MKIILTRHGETEENKAGIHQGWEPGHLSELGRTQARMLGQQLKDVKIDVIYSSDLKRCLDTAEFIRKHHPDCLFLKDERLRERNCGVFDGKVIKRSDWDGLDGDLYTNKPEGGESFNEMWVRLSRFYSEILDRYTNETILLVGHGGSMCLLQGLITGKDIEFSLSKIEKLKNTAVSEFEIGPDGTCKTIILNSEKHLK